MSRPWSREIGLLRTLATHLEQRSLPTFPVTQAFLHKEGLGHVREQGDRLIAIRAPGHKAFAELVNCLFDRLPAMGRGATQAEVEDELFIFIEGYIGQQPSDIGSADAEILLAHFEDWRRLSTSSRRVFVPCVISRISAPRSEIGPVTFEFINRVEGSDFSLGNNRDAVSHQHGLVSMLKWMRDYDAYWLARVSVEGCRLKRSEEIAEFAVDLIIVAFQLAAPNLDTRTMARLDAMRGTAQKRSLSESDG